MKVEQLRGVTGITVSDNNTLLFCDLFTSNVYFCDKNDTYQSYITSSFQPWDISTIPGTTTAVMSSTYEPYIKFIDISNRKLLYKIEVKGSKQNVGIAATKDHIIIGQKGKMQVLDVSGNFKRNIRLERSDGVVSYISVFSNGNICFLVNDEIHCVTSDGDPVFKYASPNLLDARSIQQVDDGHIYVVGRYSHKIHKLTSTGT